jgi:hypothetical protein
VKEVQVYRHIHVKCPRYGRKIKKIFGTRLNIVLISAALQKMHISNFAKVSYKRVNLGRLHPVARVISDVVGFNPSTQRHYCVDGLKPTSSVIRGCRLFCPCLLCFVVTRI